MYMNFHYDHHITSHANKLDLMFHKMKMLMAEEESESNLSVENQRKIIALSSTWEVSPVALLRRKSMLSKKRTCLVSTAYYIVLLISKMKSRFYLQIFSTKNKCLCSSIPTPQQPTKCYTLFRNLADAPCVYEATSFYGNVEEEGKTKQKRENRSEIFCSFFISYVWTERRYMEDNKEGKCVV